MKELDGYIWVPRSIGLVASILPYVMKDTFETSTSTSAYVTFLLPIMHYFAAVLKSFDRFGFYNWIYKVSGSLGIGVFLMFLWNPGFEPFIMPVNENGEVNRAYDIASLVVLAALADENFLFDSFLNFGQLLQWAFIVMLPILLLFLVISVSTSHMTD